MKIKSILAGLVLLGSISLTQAQVLNYYTQENRQILHSGAPDTNPIEVWCEDRLYELKKARTMASQAIYRGDYARAIKILISGLASASGNGYQVNPPLTQKIIERGVILGKEINARISGSVPGMKGTVHFLESYYDLIVDVAFKIDIPYYRPGQCGYCHSGMMREMENALLEVVRRQVGLANEHLLVPRTVVPLGTSDLYLKAAEMLTYFAGLDLRSSLYANYYGCQLRDLNDLHRDLLGFNSVLQTERDKKQMIYDTYYYLNDIRDSMTSNYRCR